ncbi:clavesin-1 [Agrilus planipennis]|uniref:Clavesin-1 n=1 Tax=Agrilus planipennis TaxID=224129 RepID=A0A7F5RH48_AGRPL|nr:clavesin-1 [Agrilus planipennis]
MDNMPTDNEVKSELDLGEPPIELLEYARRELGEDPDTRVQVLAEFRDMIYERGECMPHRTDDAFLLRFLRARYFVLERAHRLFVNYYNFKENNPEIFEGVNLMKLQELGTTNIITVPPYREQTGRRILLYRMGNWDPENTPVIEILQATMAILELAILEERAQILGGICIFDLGDLSMQQAWHLTPNIATKVIQIMVTSFPMKVHALHIVNQSKVFDFVYNIFKPLLNDQMRKRIFFHGDDMESLHQHINPKHLPERYGGVHPDYSYSDWIDYFKNNEKTKKELRSLGYSIDEP